MALGSHHTAHGSAPGKIILLGEHAVVYGRTALAAAIERRVEVRIVPSVGPARFAPTAIAPSSGSESPPLKKGGKGGFSESRLNKSPSVPLFQRGKSTAPSPTNDARLLPALARAAELVGIKPLDFVVTIQTDLPIGVGLGSSAALSVALVRALSRFAGRAFDDTTVCAHAYELEKLFHGFPSGIDNTVATFGGLVAFTRGRTPRALATARPIPLVVALGRAPRQTQTTVRALRARWEAEPDRYEGWFDDIDFLVDDAERVMASSDPHALGGLMNANHGLLQRLGVSTDELDQMVALARAHGALGAKLTGGGGGGAVICLCEDDRERLVQAFARAGWRAFATDIGGQRGTDAASDADELERRAVAPA